MTSPLCEIASHLGQGFGSPQTLIRRATDDDRFELFKMAAAMHKETDFVHYAFDPVTAINGLGMWLTGSNDRFMLVSTLGEAITGMLGVVARPVWFGPDIMASEEIFYIKPNFRGSRAAFKLMRAFIDEAKSIGARHIRAGVATGSSPAAERLYAHFGLKHVGGNFSGHLHKKEST